MAFTPKDLIRICSALAKSEGDYPFGPQPVCFRIGGKIFTQIYPLGVKGAVSILKNDETIPRSHTFPMVTFKCDPAFKDLMCLTYPHCVFRGYHVPGRQQPYFLTVLNHSIPDETLLLMAGHACRQIYNSLPKKLQREIPPPSAPSL